MKTYFKQLFDYDLYTNNLLLDAMASAGNPQETVKLMAHLFGAQQVWLSRCSNDPTIGTTIWPDWQAGKLKQIAQDNHAKYIAYLDSLNADAFEQIITYKTSKGVPFETKLVDILTHVINHGTHHRGQIGQLLKFAGAEQLPGTDYILFVRDL